ncbi:hypothetical protein [Saccharopolyspora flava]|nr:hypothetical protein [Saccharopolyspora flava]
MGIVLLGHTYIVRTLLLVTAASCVVFGISLLCAHAVKRRGERRAGR